MEKEIIYPKVVVYKNAVPKSKEYVDLLKFSEGRDKEYQFIKWEDWYGFGDFMNIGMPNEEDIDLLIPESNNDYEIKQIEFIKDISRTFYKVTKDYIDEYNIELPNWVPGGLSICKYNTTAEDIEYAMFYHTDYRESDAEVPGNKFAITCTIYLNDDYEGGGLKFLRDDNGDVIDYKPSAGDVVVFPSGDPLTGSSHYFHGVDRIDNGNKYFIRCFWMYHYEGSENWHKGVEEYGEEVWQKMHDEQLKKNVNSGMYHKYVVKPNQKDPKYGKAKPFFLEDKNDN